MRCVFALPLTLTLAWALVGAAQTNPFYQPLKAKHLSGMKVENSDGDKVGNIHNLVLDMQSGELKYAVIASGGILGVAPSLKLVPSEIISAATTKRETLAVHVTTWQWRSVPNFKPSALADLSAPSRAKEISTFFEPTISQMREKQGLLSSTGQESNGTAGSSIPVLKFASTLIGTRVVTPQKERIGEVTDLLVAFGSPGQAFVIISTGRFFEHGRQYAAPLHALATMDKSKALVLNADPASLQQAPSFDVKSWETHRTNQLDGIYVYSKSDD